MKGVIQTVDSWSHVAVISAENGQEYTMRIEQWNDKGNFPQIGQNVEFMVAGSSAIDVNPDRNAPSIQQQPSSTFNNNTNPSLQASHIAQNLSDGVSQSVDFLSNAFNQLPQVQEHSRKSEDEFKSTDWIIKAVKSSLNFKGRSRRAEFVNFVLFTIGILIVAKMLALSVGMLIGGNLIYMVAMLVLFIPFVAVTTRRLHDLNATGWLQVLLLLPVFNLCFLIFLMLKDSNAGPNKFGNPVK